MIPVSIGNVLLETLIKVFSKPFTLISPAWSWEQEELLRWDKKYFLTHLLMKFQEPCSHCSLLRVFHPTEVIFHQCQIDLMTSLHQMSLHSNPHWLTSSSLNLIDSPPLYYNLSKGGTDTPDFCYWLVSLKNIAINLSQYFTNNLNTSISYSCQHTWGTSQLELD